jgi:hypothetical protein
LLIHFLSKKEVYCFAIMDTFFRNDPFFSNSFKPSTFALLAFNNYYDLTFDTLVFAIPHFGLASQSFKRASLNF